MKTTIHMENRAEFLDVEVRGGEAFITICEPEGRRRVMRDLQDAVEMLFPLTEFSVASQYEALGNLAAGISDSLRACTQQGRFARSARG